MWLVALQVSEAAIRVDQFENVTGTAARFHVGESYGASWGDVNWDGWPDLFVNNHRLFPSLYRNNGNGTFTDIARQVDPGTWRNRPLGDQHGATWADFDNDGDQDLFVSTGVCCDSQFLVNIGGIFEDRTALYGVGVDFEGRMPIWSDFRPDGLLDFVMMNGRKNALMRQEPPNFVDRTLAAGLDCIRTSYGHLSDLNGDGRMELICARDGAFPKKIYDITTVPFRDVTTLLPPTPIVTDTAIADFNGDRRPDVFLVKGNLRLSEAAFVNPNNPNRMEMHVAGGPGESSSGEGGAAEQGVSFRTTGAITVNIDSKQVSGRLKVFIGANGINPATYPSFSLSPSNPNVVGIQPHNPATDLGLYVGYNPATQRWQILFSTGPKSARGYIIVESTAPMSALESVGFQTGDRPVAPRLLVNTGTGFQDVTRTAGLSNPISCAGVSAGDFDNDMDVDLYLVCRGGVQNLPDILYENQGNGTFVRIPNAGGAAGVVGVGLESGAGTGENVAIADYDVNGFLDLFVTNGLNMQPFKLGGPDQMFRNRGNLNEWIELDLVGTASNRDGIGARVLATAGGVTQLREHNHGYHRWSQDHQRIHFGLGSNSTVNLRIEWPSGVVNQHFGVAANTPHTVYRVTEGGAIQKVTLGPARGLPPPRPGDECGKPRYDKATEAAVFIWKDCNTGLWHVRGTGGGSATLFAYQGSVTSNRPFVSPTRVGMEPSDVLDTSTAGAIRYRMNVNGSAEDGFDFSLQSSASGCFAVDAPASARVLVGGRALQGPQRINLNTLGGC
jgi:hypothetical protein